jgi:hypothetical protein
MMLNSNEKQEFYWHESAGARILVPSQFVIRQPFPELSARSKKNALDNIIVLITSQEGERLSAERIIRQRLISDDDFRCEVLHEGTVNDPFPGIERVVQLHNLMDPSVNSYYWRRLHYLDETLNIIADIDVGGFGLFRDFEQIWQTVMDSFSWDRDKAVVLNTDEEFYAFRKRYAPKRKKREVETGSIPQLPLEIGYLQPLMDELMTYNSEDLNEDVDTPLLDNLVEERIKGLSIEDAQEQLGKDARILKQWLHRAGEGGSQAAFIHGYLESYILYGFGRWWEKGEEDS